MTTSDDRTSRADRQARVEAALALYPDLDAGSLADVLQWFRKEASALDVAMLASNPDLRVPYEGLKADHLDRFTVRDISVAIGLIAGFSGLVASVIWFGL